MTAVQSDPDGFVGETAEVAATWHDLAGAQQTRGGAAPG